MSVPASVSPSAADGQSPIPEPESETSPTTEKPKPKIDPSKDLWVNIALNVKDAMLEPTDQTVIVCGASQCGKTSIIQRMTKGTADERPKPTTALDYSYGKREDRNVTQIVHFWELAHDTDLAQLADIVITAETIHQTIALIVVDCADPASALGQVIFWLRRIDARVAEIFEKMRAKGSSTPDKMLTRAKKRVGESHPDLPQLRLCGLPMVIILSRLDKLASDTVNAKLIVRTMRLLAHLYGCSLLFTSQQEREAHKMRSLLSHVIFDQPFDARLQQKDIDKGGVLILAGQDSFADIGDPSPTASPGFVPLGDSTLDRWRAPYEETFPSKAVSKSKEDDSFKAKLYDPVGGYGEPAIDQMRKLKDAELEQYRRSLVAKKASETRKDASGDAGS